MKTRAFAKQLRQQDVPAEYLLWQELRGRRCGGYKFVRQQPIASYVVDFVCRRAKVVVELDGLTHMHRVSYDTKRTQELERYGYQVIRFDNEDVYQSLSEVVEAIFQFLERANGRELSTPSSALRAPSPFREKDA
ncbi:MAG: DUF559 domain-containing protein [Pseudomonadota bacterium]